MIKRRGDSQTFTKGHKCATTEFSEANGAVPPKIHLPEPEFASESESIDTPSLRGLLPPRFLLRKSFSCSIFPGSDDSIQDVPTPIARPIEIPPPEKLQLSAIFLRDGPHHFVDILNLRYRDEVQNNNEKMAVSHIIITAHYHRHTGITRGTRLRKRKHAWLSR